MATARMNLHRRRWLAYSALSAAAGYGLFRSGFTSAQAVSAPGKEVLVIKVMAQKFMYTPSQILIKKGQACVLEFTALDFVHGFSIPDLKIRSDLMPGRVTRVELQIEREGVYDFLCDNFCGSGHEEMAGQIVVSA